MGKTEWTQRHTLSRSPWSINKSPGSGSIFTCIHIIFRKELKFKKLENSKKNMDDFRDCRLDETENLLSNNL